MKSFRQRLQSGETLVGDGAWGTLLMEMGLEAGRCPEAANLEQPQLLAEIAGLYLAAGADLVTANTFGASPRKLRSYGLENSTEAINRAGVEVLRRVVAGRAYVSASVGPTGELLKPYGDCEPEEVAAGFERQIGALVAAGAHLICVETMTDLQEATLAVQAARTVAPEIPVVATMTFDPTPRGFFTMMGVSVAQAAAGLAEAGADVVGSNCGHGIEKMIAIARELKQCTHLPVVIQANAGLPERRDGVNVYPETPQFMAAKAGELLDLGVEILGGCCGTTPDHTRALRRLVDKRRGKNRRA